MKNVLKKRKQIRESIMNLVEAISGLYDNAGEMGEAGEGEEETAGGVHAEFAALYKDVLDKMRGGELPGDENTELHECGYVKKITELIAKNGGWFDFPVDIFEGALFGNSALSPTQLGTTFLKFPDGTVFAYCPEIVRGEKCIINSRDDAKISPAELIEKIKAEGKSGNVFIAITGCGDESNDIETVIADSENKGEFYVFGGCWQAELKFADNVIQVKELNDTYTEYGPSIYNPVVLGIENAEAIPAIGGPGENHCEYSAEMSYELDDGEKITPENGLDEILAILNKLAG